MELILFLEKLAGNKEPAQEAELRKAGRTIGFNCYILSNFSSLGALPDFSRELMFTY